MSDQCIVEDQKKLLEELLTKKIEVLKEEFQNEKSIFEKTGFYSNRDTEEIEEELKIAEKVLSNIDNIPKCSKLQ